METVFEYPKSNHLANRVFQFVEDACIGVKMAWLECNFRRAYWESCVSKELASVICFATTGFVSRFRPCVRNRWVFRLGGMLGRECFTQHVVYG